MIDGYERLGVTVNHVWGMTETESLRHLSAAFAKVLANALR